MTKHKGTIVINSTESDDFYFNVVAENGSIITSSKMYPSEKDVLKGIDIVKDIFSAEKLDIIGLGADNE